MANQEFQIQNIEKPKRKFWKFVAGFFGIIILAVGGFFVWDKYLSPQAKSQSQMEKQYEAYMEWEERHKQALREDTYGGKTPEETLQMFIEALKKGDIELASKYFALDTNEQSYNAEYYLTRKKWEEGLKKAKDEGKLEGIINIVSMAIPTPNQESSQDTFWFSVFNNKGETEQLIEMFFNTDSRIWKIVNI